MNIETSFCLSNKCAEHYWDITYIRLAQGFGYLVAIMDWYSRKVLAWRLSNTLDAGFCVDCFQGAVRRFGSGDFQHRSRRSIHQP